jgi:hypothetical protein
MNPPRPFLFFPLSSPFLGGVNGTCSEAIREGVTWSRASVVDVSTTDDVEADMLANVLNDGSGRAMVGSTAQVKRRAAAERHVRAQYHSCAFHLPPLSLCLLDAPSPSFSFPL